MTTLPRISPARNSEIAAFLAKAGHARATRIPLAEDASFRRYERILPPGHLALDLPALNLPALDLPTLILMDAPPDREPVAPFLCIDDHLRDLALSAPAVLTADIDRGFLLLEDLGDDSFARLTARDRGAEAGLYEAAVDVLVHLRGTGRPAARHGHVVGDYDAATFACGPRQILDWHMPALGLSVDEPARASFARIWDDLWPLVTGGTPTLMLRDYHADNLHWLAERTGIARVGLLDFQLAAMGPAAYDLMSLIEDPRRDVAPEMRSTLIARYRAGALAKDPAFDGDAFETQAAIMAAQRLSRIAGQFVRLWRRDGKPRYLSFLPRVWAHLQRDLTHPALGALKSWYDHHLPGDACRAGVRDHMA